MTVAAKVVAFGIAIVISTDILTDLAKVEFSGSRVTGEAKYLLELRPWRNLSISGQGRFFLHLVELKMNIKLGAQVIGCSCRAMRTFKDVGCSRGDRWSGRGDTRKKESKDEGEE